MIPDDYGAAEPLIEIEKNLIRKGEKVESFLNKIPTYDDFKKKDTSWHDSRVKEANESFRKSDKSKRKYVSSPANKGTVAKKKPTQKSAPKKITGKR